ncbi:MAG: NAD(P)/FAD-dependent oxidoreductase [Bacteroidota bacterium]
MVQSYKKKHQLESLYDVIIIGSGIGSLTAGVFLAKAGKKVLILERHYTAGGYTHIFKRRGYEWDVGIHYIGEVGRPNSILRRLFDYISDSKLEWADMGEVYDRIVVGDKTYDFVKGANNFKARLIEYFPNEADAIKAYVDLVFKTVKTSRNYFLEKAMPPLVAKLSGGIMRGPFLKMASKTTREVLEGLTQNEELITVLTGQYGDYGLAPAESSFAMHASVARHYFAGGYFPIGGSSRIVETVADVLEKHKSTILVSAEVDELILEGKTAVGVRMKDGKTFHAPTIISGAGIMTTYKTLLPEGGLNTFKLEQQLQKVKASAAHICLYVGLNGDPDELKLPKANYWIYPKEGTHESNIQRYLDDIDQPFPVVYVSFPSAKDPDWSNRYPGRSTIDIISIMPYELFEQWEGTAWKKRGESYEALKEKMAQRLLETLFEQEPHLRDAIDCYELSTPITTKHFVNYANGEIYGLDHDPSRFQHKFLRPHTPIKNLYLTGQDIVTAGIGGALFAGVITASAITRKNMIRDIF